ncbi:MAG TPA: DUF222 domain-containing protein [Mycobacteriales bacterium]|nr:DUF222 domain-containing protein [Mycobacteriales bacterium]
MLTSETQALADDVARLVAQDVHSLPDVLLLSDTEALLALRRRLDGVLARRLQVLDTRDVTTTERGQSTKTWLVEEHQLSVGDAAARLRVARSAASRPAIVDAMLAGEATQDQAGLILGFLPKLPKAEQRDAAEKELLDAARFADPTLLGRGLRELADRLCLNETAEERAVRAREGRYLTLTDTFDEMVRVDGMLDRVGATILRKALYPLSARAGEVDERTPVQRQADALVELARLTMNAGSLPETAGEPTQVLVTTFLSDLLRSLEAGESCQSSVDGVAITPNTARMFACDAGIIPAVMGGASEVLDLGRSTRTWSRAQRRAAKLRANGHCEAPGCRAAIERCDLHHSDYWSHGGATDLASAIYLCAYHHWLEHHTAWHFSRNKDGTVEVRKT